MLILQFLLICIHNLLWYISVKVKSQTAFGLRSLDSKKKWASQKYMARGFSRMARHIHRMSFLG